MTEADVGQLLENVIDELVSSGRYRSKSEVLREGVRLVKEKEARLVDLDGAIHSGIADANAGRTRPFGDVFDDLITKHEGGSRAGS